MYIHLNHSGTCSVTSAGAVYMALFIFVTASPLVTRPRHSLTKSKKGRKIRNMRKNLLVEGLKMNGDKKLAIFGFAAACVIGFINHMQYRNLANRMEDLEVTVEMDLFPYLVLPHLHAQERQEEEEPDWWKENFSSPCDAGCSDGERCPSFRSSM